MIFYHLETWQPDLSPTLNVAKGKTPIQVTTYLSKIETFQRHMTTTAFKLASTGVGGAAQQASQQYIRKIAKSFIDALYAFLDGLVHLASEENGVPGPSQKVAIVDGVVADADLPPSGLQDTVGVHLVVVAWLPLTSHRIPDYFSSFQI
jgi:hypothetical protein